jgi:hypothetical protein
VSTEPFFEHSSVGAVRANRRLLLLSYHFPPDTTIGARRWEKLSHFVAERGWGLDVITCATEEVELPRLEALPGDVRIYGVPPQPARLAEWTEHAVWRIYRALRPTRTTTRSANAATPNSRVQTPKERPDTVLRSEVHWRPLNARKLLRTYWAWLDSSRDRRWAELAAQLARGILQPDVHFAIVTSGPPHMTHEAGRILSLEYGLPFVMDMRDPWSLSERLPDRWASPLWLNITARYERAMVQQAALVVANTDPARETLANAYPEARERVIAVMNGTDDEPIPQSRRGGRFTICYAGTVYDYSDPHSLFQAAARVIANLHLTPAEFGMEFIGSFDDASEQLLRGLAGTEGVGEYVSVGPARPHEQALEFMAGATMLVTFPGWNSVAIPGKVFECVRFDAWLLALSDANSATERLLRGTDADVVPREEIERIAAVITRRYEAHLREERPVRIARDGRFSRRHQAQILLDAIARLAHESEMAPAPDTAAHTRRTSLSH